MGIRKSNLGSLALPAGTHVLPVDQLRTVLQTYPQVQIQYGQAGAMVPRQTKYAVSTGVVLLSSDAPFTLVSNESTLRNIKVPELAWVPQLNGTDQYWTFSESIPVPQGGTLSFNLRRPISSERSSEYLVSGAADTNTVLAFGNESDLFVGTSGYLSNLRIDGVVKSTLAADGAFHTVEANSTTNLAEVKNLGCRFTFERLLLGVITDFTVRDAEGVITNHLQLTNKDQGAIQLATVGNVNATMVGYSEDVWIPN